MGRFNFSNMQNKQDAPADNSFIPVEFRDAVVDVSTQPTIPEAIQPKAVAPEKETFTAGGFIDETGNWNDGNGIVPQKTSDEEWNKSIAGQIVNSNAYKKYFYNREEVLKEAQTMSKSLKIPENVILKDADSLAKTREIYNFQQKQMDKDAVFEAYPELGKIAAKSESDAAIALHNLQNVKRVHGIFEAATTGNTIDAITKERSDIGRKLIDGKKLTMADWNRVNELEQALRDQKEIPDLLEAPVEAIVGGTAQQLPMLLRHGIKAQPYGLATGMIGGVISGAATGGVGTGVGFAQGYKTGVKIGYGVEMFKEIAGGYALDYMRYQDKQGNRLFTDNEASTFAIAAALLEAGIELSNYDLVLKTLGGGSAVKRIRDIVSSAQDTASARARLLTMIKDKAVDTGKVAVSESMEEAVQQLATDTVQNVAAIYKPYGNLRVLKDYEITRNAVQAFWQALPASIGLGAGAAGMNSVQVVRDAAHAMVESKQQKEQQRIANEQNVLAQLYEERDNSELSQKSPETFDNLVQENVHGTKYENVYIDTEIANEDKETRIVLNQLAQAAGITEEEVAVINETGAKLSIPTSVLVRSIEDVEVRRKLQNLISFDEAEDCFIRNKRTAKAAIKEMERIAEENVKRQAQAITNIVGETFSDEYERSLAEFIIFQNPDMTPYEAYKKYKAEAKQELEAQLAPIMQQMRDGMGHGITEYWADRETGEEADVGDLIGKQETQEGGSFKHIRVSNNAPWLQKFVKQNGKSPSQKDMKKIAIDILKGYDEYSVYGLDMNNADMDDLAKTKATIEEIQNRLAALEGMDAKMKTVDQADIEALESLSPEAVQVYRDLKDKLSQGNKEVKAAARVEALVWAYRCDRFAQYMQNAGHKDYTALDYYKRLQLDASGNAGVGVGNYFNQAAMQKENKRYILNDKGSIDWGYVNNIFADDGTEIKKAPVRMQVGYQVGVDGPGAGYVHIHNRHIDFIKNKGYANIFDIATSVLDNADFICLNNSRDGRPRLEVFVDLSPKTSIMLIMDYTEEKNDAYYTIVSIMPRSKKQLIDKKEKALSFNGSVRPYTTHQQDSVFYTPTDKNAGTNGDSIADKDNAFGTVSLSDADEYVKKYTYDEDVAEQQNTSFEQRAYHSSYNQSAGTRAITADKQLLEQAKNMEAEGAGREEIYKATGWHKGVDGMWRFEIPDNLDNVAPVIKGQTDLLSNGERIVRLFATADQSTFLHESAHIFYEDMRELAQDAKAPEELKKDFAKLSDWCRWREDSIKDYEGSAVYKEFAELDKQIKSAKDKPEQAQLLARWEQERFARAFEEYLKQGSAPTKGLAKAFAQLKKWLVKIYRGFISVGAVPSKDVTDIMDRMLVSEEEADRYRKELDLEGFRREGGLKYLNDNVAQMWEQTYLEAVDAAKAKVMKIAMRDITDKNKQERVEKLNKEREQERERLSHDPVFIVWKALQNKDLAGIGMTETCKNVGITVDEYAKKIKAYGGSLDAAVEDHMWLYERELKEMDIEELKAEARKALDSSYYCRLLNSFEAEFLETAIRKEQRLSRKILRREQLTEQELKEADVLLAKLDKRKDKEHAYWKSVREEIVRYKKKLKEDYKEQASASVKAYREEADKRAMRNLDEKEDRGRRALRDAVKNHSADIKDYAEKALAKLSIKDGAAVPGIWRKKAKERSQQCNYHISKFDWQKARDAKVMELIYNTMADIAQTNQNKVKRKADALKRRQNTIQREKNLPAKERYLYNHLLYMVGLAKADVPKPQGFDFQEMIASYKGDMEMAFIDADGNITLSDWFIGTAFGDAAPQNVNNLKMAQFKELADFMDNLYTVGVNAKQFKTVTDFDGKKVTIEDAAMAIALGNKAGYNNDPDITKAGSETAIEKAVRWGKRSYLSLVKAETIFRTVGAECMHYCYNPIKQAADNELKETELLVQRLQTIRNNYRKSVKQRFLRQIMSESPGIDTKQAEKQADKAADKYMDELTEKKYVLGTSKISRENILVFALNWGTEKNRLRVVDGFSEDRQKIDAADIENLLKELNGADWTFVSDIWKLFDSYWPRLQDVESRMTGVTMEKEKAVEFSILGKDNQVYILDGGYYPIKYDRDKNVQTLQQANDEAARMNMSGSARLGTKLGQTKARSNFNVKGRKIRVDLDVVAEVLSDNIHIITMREAVRDVNRIINHPVFKGMIENSFGKETYTMLQQWVLDCWAREQRSIEWLEVLAQHLRTKQTMAVLGFRTTTALLNILNIAPMADYLGVTRTLKSIKDYYTDKLTNGGKQYEMCMEKSVFLRNRAQTMDRDMRSVIEKQKYVMGGKLDNIQKSAFYFITQTDLMLACPLWISEYKRVYRELVEENAKKRAQLDKQGTENPDIIIKKEDVIEREAVNAGDAAVRRVFGSGQIQDLAAVQKGSEVTKMFTMYYSYFSVVLNALDYKFRETRNKKRTEAMAHIAMGFLFWIILPAVGDTLIKTLISGNDDDKEPEEILKRTGANILNSAAGGIPILRDVVPALTNYALTGKFYGTGGTVFDETMGQTMRILSAIKSDSKDGYDVARESLKLFDNMSGFPQTVTDGIISAMEFMHYGEFTAESIREYLWAIAFDKRPDKKK